MKKKIIFPAILATGLGIVCCFAAFKQKNKKQPVVDKQGFALVELFTSEGCSSCPPAEALAKEYQEKYVSKNVLFLSYHVDYWDRLGWKDPFSMAKFSDRQRYYSSTFSLDNIYTPQAVVNGSTEFVGSNGSKLEQSITSQISNQPQANTGNDLEAVVENGNQVKITDKSNVAADKDLLLLMVEKAATTQVKAGENRGETLSHINIVRDFAKGNQVMFTLPKGLTKQDLFAVSIVQNKVTGQVLSFSTINLK